jgi:hypothetical protein
MRTGYVVWFIVLGALRLAAQAPATEVLVTAPLADALVGGVVAVSVNALDRSGISRVELYQDGTLAATATVAPYQFSWDTTKISSGPHTLKAVAYNLSNVTASANLNLTVGRPPVVTITAPDSRDLTLVTSITLTATVVTDNAGVQSVQFFENGTRLGDGSPSGPGAWSFVWNGVAGGTYAITVTATDTNGLVSTTAPMTIVVHNPVVSAGGILNAATLTGGQSIASGSLVSIFGADLAQSTLSAGPRRLPTSLSDTSVLVTGKETAGQGFAYTLNAPITFASPSQIN